MISLRALIHHGLLLLFSHHSHLERAHLKSELTEPLQLHEARVS